MKTIYCKALIPILLSGLTLISFSCQEEESAWFPVVGRGNVQTEYRNAEPFQKIKCLMSGDVIIQQSISQTLRVSAQENLLVVKTKKSRLNEVITLVKQIHRYGMAEIIALPIIGGNEDYLNWIDNQVTKD